MTHFKQDDEARDPGRRRILQGLGAGSACVREAPDFISIATEHVVACHFSGLEDRFAVTTNEHGNGQAVAIADLT